MSGQQRDIILQESGKASFQAKLPEEKPFLCRVSSRIRTYEVIRQRIYSPPSLPLEHSRIFKWSLVESRFRDFQSRAYTKSAKAPML